MSYYTYFNLDHEPFSTSPDPRFLYRSMSHISALQRIEISIRLRRGLVVILGDVGTGKTTLSRALLQSFKADDKYLFHIILDPDYKSEFQFLSALCRMFKVKPKFRSTLDYREAIEQFLFQKGVEEDKTIVLLIDEGQKLSPSFLEILRILLNYETNEYKLLQLVIFAQMELLPKIKRIRNFMDRICLKYILNPLDIQETANLIRFRLKEAGLNGNSELFTPKAIEQIHRFTQGYPRRIIHTCHHALEHAIMCDKRQVDESLVSYLITNEVV
ncbi:MAG: AAA family ATPase [Candidatus Auribacterota bacterium]|nr:AAA family ATPase [Candidatus Auribacterota bacterium]